MHRTIKISWWIVKKWRLEAEWNYKDGKYDGLCRSWDDNGQLRYEVKYKDGKQDALFRRYYENGQLSGEGIYTDGEKDGLFRAWHENGQLYYEENYQDGERISEKRWDINGNLTKDKTYWSPNIILSSSEVGL